jgi:hypothetical protein
MAEERKVELIGWHIVEQMTHGEEYYVRTETSDDGVDWWHEGYQGLYEYSITDHEPELAEELEAAYQKSKQGYAKDISNKFGSLQK